VATLQSPSILQTFPHRKAMALDPHSTHITNINTNMCLHIHRKYGSYILEQIIIHCIDILLYSTHFL